MRIALLGLALTGCMTPLTNTASLDAPGRHEVTLEGSGVTLGGILWRPATSGGPAPAVIVLHGWGPPGEPGAPRVESTARALADLGYVALALSMRGWPPSGGFDDCGLRQPNDVVQAAEWLARLPGVDRERIGAVGFSQGGQVALLAAAYTRRIKAVVAYFPVTDIERWRETTSHPGIRDEYVPQICRPAASRSPVNLAPEIGAAVLLIHGDADTRVPTEQSVRMHEALRSAGRTAELRLIAGAGHEFSAVQRAEAWPVATGFLARNLPRIR